MTGIEDKIAKLLRLSQNEAATEAEASLAAERAADLMRKHGIEMAQISLEEGERLRIDKHLLPGAKLDLWRRNLAASVARASGGEVVYTRYYGKWHGEIHFFGPEGTVQGMVDLYLYLEEQLDRMSLVAASTVTHVNAAMSMRWRRSYLLGIGVRVCQRLDAKAARFEQPDSGSGMEIVLVKDAVQKKIEEVFPEVKKDKANADYDPFAAMQGHADGAGIGLGDDELLKRTVEELES